MKLEYHLSSEERNRPIEDQFPFMRTDLDQLSKIAESLTKSNAFLDNLRMNRSLEMERDVNTLFVEYMRGKGMSLISIRSTDERKLTGVQLTLQKGDTVQWDGIYAGVDDHGDGIQANIFLIETKEIANARDIFENERNLCKKAKKTLQYFEQLKQTPSQRKPLKGKTTVDFQKEQISSYLKVPLDGEEHSIEPKVVVIYASGNMPSDVFEKLKMLRDEFKGKIHVWSMECPRLTACHIEDFSNQSQP